MPHFVILIKICLVHSCKDSECVWNFSSGFFMEDSGTDSRMQTRECSGLHDRGKGAKTPERPIKAHSGTFHGIFTPFPAFHSLHSPPYASFQDPESPVKLPVKIRIKIQTHSKNFIIFLTRLYSIFLTRIEAMNSFLQSLISQCPPLVLPIRMILSFPLREEISLLTFLVENPVCAAICGCVMLGVFLIMSRTLFSSLFSPFSPLFSPTLRSPLVADNG